MTKDLEDMSTEEIAQVEKSLAAGQEPALAEEIEARIEEIRDDIDKAQARFDRTKANKLYQEALALEALLPGGTDPIIGSAGRSV